MKSTKIISFLGLALILEGCDKTRTVLGLNRQENDEFSVLRTPDLSLPPNFDDLPSPIAKNDAGDWDSETTNKARGAALGQFTSSVAHETHVSGSAGEAELLKNAQSDLTVPNIRKTVAKEAKQETAKNKSVVKEFFNIKDSGQDLDPFEEKKRLEESQSKQD